MFNLKLLACAGLMTLCLAQAQTPVGSVARQYAPLNRSERWQRYLDQTLLSPSLYFASLGAALGAQLAHDPPEWGQGFEAYSRRSASSFGTFMIQGTVRHGGAALLGYDPRYLACDCAGGFHRFAHALEWTLLTKNREGQTRVDVPALAGAYGAGMLTMFWYPARYNPLTDGVRVGSQQFGYLAGVNVLREFSPELKRFFHVPHRFGKNSP